MTKPLTIVGDIIEITKLPTPEYGTTTLGLWRVRPPSGQIPTSPVYSFWVGPEGVGVEAKDCEWRFWTPKIGHLVRIKAPNDPNDSDGSKRWASWKDLKGIFKISRITSTTGESPIIEILAYDEEAKAQNLHLDTWHAKKIEFSLFCQKWLEPLTLDEVTTPKVPEQKAPKEKQEVVTREAEVEELKVEDQVRILQCKDVRENNIDYWAPYNSHVCKLQGKIDQIKAAHAYNKPAAFLLENTQDIYFHRSWLEKVEDANEPTKNREEEKLVLLSKIHAELLNIQERLSLL